MEVVPLAAPPPALYCACAAGAHDAAAANAITTAAETFVLLRLPRKTVFSQAATHDPGASFQTLMYNLFTMGSFCKS
jgi:hypothetical protein